MKSTLLTILNSDARDSKITLIDSHKKAKVFANSRNSPLKVVTAKPRYVKKVKDRSYWRKQTVNDPNIPIEQKIISRYS